MNDNKYLRLLVNGKMVLGEVGMYNGLCHGNKDYIVQLQVIKDISPNLKKGKEESHLRFDELVIGNIYELKLSFKNNEMDLGLFLYDNLLTPHHDDVDDEIIYLTFERL